MFHFTEFGILNTVLVMFAIIGCMFITVQLIKFFINFKEHYDYLKEIKEKHWEYKNYLSKIEWDARNALNKIEEIEKRINN